VTERILPVAFFVSGEGTTLDGIAERVAQGDLPVRIVLVVADREATPGLARAQARGLPTCLAPFRGTDPSAWSEVVDAALRRAGAEAVVLAGFLSVLPNEFLGRWRGRIINLHPSLLPKFGGRGLYGARVHRAVLEAHESESGATVHVVTDDVDRGPILAQVRLALRPDETVDSLRARLHPHEVTVLAETLRRLADGTIPLPVPLAPGPAPHP
jgi:phosphoribosylglycinamide formyltransferase-1